MFSQCRKSFVLEVIASVSTFLQEKVYEIDEIEGKYDLFDFDNIFASFDKFISEFIQKEVKSMSKELNNLLKNFFNSKFVRNILTSNQSPDMSAFNENGLDKIQKYLADYLETISQELSPNLKEKFADPIF